MDGKGRNRAGRKGRVPPYRGAGGTVELKGGRSVKGSRNLHYFGQIYALTLTMLGSYWGSRANFLIV